MNPSGGDDEELARRIALEEADREYAITLSNTLHRSPQDEPPLPPPPPPSAPHPERQNTYPKAQELPTYTPAPDTVGPAPTAHLPIRMSPAAKLESQLRPKAFIIGAFALFLFGISLAYLFGFILGDDLAHRKDDHKFHDPAVYDVLMGIVWAGLAVAGLIGVIAAWRRSHQVSYAYMVTLAGCFTLAVLFSILVAVHVRATMSNDMSSYGCYTLTGSTTWTEEECRAYRAEALAAQYFWVFPLFLGCIFVPCACYFRVKLAKLQKASTVSLEMHELVPAPDMPSLILPSNSQPAPGSRDFNSPMDTTMSSAYSVGGLHAPIPLGGESGVSMTSSGVLRTPNTLSTTPPPLGSSLTISAPIAHTPLHPPEPPQPMANTVTIPTATVHTESTPGGPGGPGRRSMDAGAGVTGTGMAAHPAYATDVGGRGFNSTQFDSEANNKRMMAEYGDDDAGPMSVSGHFQTPSTGGAGIADDELYVTEPTTDGQKVQW
eukprot:TRINITY_DN8819_c0_g2_i1.p1 TRINITY_DN8819_c0_g2~~TRINITY_DN8819_c0_g2_i1.p1  ORF type:complete len:498 (+),score=52.01 TRINITY_DN8819_c0_g2_i1:27-1496(+)